MANNSILVKINSLMKELEAVGKNSVNQQQGFKFRGIDTMLNTFKPLFTKHGIVLSVDTIKHEQEIKEVTRSSGKPGVDKHVSLLLKYTFHSIDDGSSISSTVPAEGLDSGDKATTKALSMGLKYALIQTFTVPTEDMDDGDKDSPVIESSKSESKAAPAAAKPLAVTERPKFQRPAANQWSK